MTSVKLQPIYKVCGKCNRRIRRPKGKSNHAWSLTKYHPKCVPSRKGVIAMPKPMPVAVPPTIPDAGRNTGWRLRALCLDVDPELFFPISPDGPDAWKVAEVKSLCRRCPVKRECLAFAYVAAPEGTYGGMTEWERDAVLRQRRTA